MKYRIKEFRQAQKMTQEELAQKTGLSRGAISRLESDNDVATSTDTLEAIANVLKVPVPLLFLP